MSKTRDSALLASGFLIGWLASGAPSVVEAATRFFEFGGASLSRRLEQAGPPAISPGVGIAERVPDDGTRHFSLTVATENRAARADTAALYALMDGHGPIGEVWGANLLAFAHSDMTSGGVQGLEIDVGNLGASDGVGVTALNLFAMGAKPSDVALGILNAPDDGSGGGGFSTGIAFHSNSGGPAVHDTLLRVDDGFGEVGEGLDLRAARFRGAAIATPGFEVGPLGGVRSSTLATGRTAFLCATADGQIFASAAPCAAAAPAG